MKSIRKYAVFFCSILTICILCTATINASAENLTTNAKGYSILSSGGWGFGHAGLMRGPLLINDQGTEMSNSIIHVAALVDVIEYSQFHQFLNNNTFLGFYSPKAAMTTTQQNQVIATAEALNRASAADSIIYCVSTQLKYSGYATKTYHGQANTKVIMPANVTSLRCDGLVEYCYEYNNIRISGPASSWNIAIANTANQDWHSSRLTVISPKIQAYTYMNSMNGDLDADGKIVSADSRIALRIATKLDTPSHYQTITGDVTGNGSIQSNDAQLILQHATKVHTGDFPKTTNIKLNNPNNSQNLLDIFINALDSIC